MISVASPPLPNIVKIGVITEYIFPIVMIRTEVSGSLIVTCFNRLLRAFPIQISDSEMETTYGRYGAATQLQGVRFG